MDTSASKRATWNRETKMKRNSVTACSRISNGLDLWIRTDV